jgi:vacuolar iron transporter family protein
MAIRDLLSGSEGHRAHKAGWLRAAVLGANDGLVATSSLMIGVAAAGKDDFLITAGIAAITAGAMSMAVGEYVSVRSQTDIENADRNMEIEQLANDPHGEMLELAEIYQRRGLTKELSIEVAKQMHQFDALESHLRDELGQFEHTKARPVQAAIASAISYTLGSSLPFMGALAPSIGTKVGSIVLFTLIGLIFSGLLSAKTAGSNLGATTARILLGGSLGMAITAGIGSLVHLSGI